jgi:hypothetical protein
MALLFAKNNSLSAVTALPASISGGGLNLISTQTASSSATIDFTSGIDSTYKEYIFKFINLHPSADAVAFLFNMSTDSGSNYNVTKTTTIFEARHTEDGATSSVAYSGRTLSEDLAQSTSFQRLANNVSSDSDHGVCGYIHLFDPSNTTFIKNYIGLISVINNNNGAYQYYNAGYGNTTSAVDAIQFKMDSGNIDSGTIKLYGVT